MTINNTTIANSFDVAANARTSSVPFVDEFQSRDPTTSDIQYPIQKKWLNTTTNAWWELKNFNSNSGITTANWVLIGNQAAAAETLTTDDAVVVPPTGNNINIFGDGVITTSGNAGTSTVTINAGGTLATEYVADVGSAIPAANILNILGDGNVTTTGAGNTITVELASSFYSTGNWLPNLSFGGASVGITYGVQYGEYTRIGNLVTFTAYIELTSKGSSVGFAAFTNLPFTAVNAAHVASTMMATTEVTFGVGYTAPYASVIPNTTILGLFASGSGLIAHLLDDTDFANTSHVSISGTYFIA